MEHSIDFRARLQEMKWHGWLCLRTKKKRLWLVSLPGADQYRISERQTAGTGSEASVSDFGYGMALYGDELMQAGLIVSDVASGQNPEQYNERTEISSLFFIC